MDDGSFKRINNLFTIIAALFGVVATVFGLINQRQTSQLSQEIAKLDGDLKRAEESRKQSEFEIKFRQEIYKEVKVLLQDNIGKKGSAALPNASLVLTLVNTLPQDRPDQRLFHASVAKIVNGMMPQEDSAEAAQLRRDIRDATQTQTLDARGEPSREFFQPVKSVVLSEKGWDVDIFYCTGVPREPDNTKVAQQAYAHLERVRGDLGRLRLRKLPRDVNELPQYRGQGLIVRADDNEQERARKLITELREGGLPGFTVAPNEGRSPWYLSAFVCASP